LPVSFPVQIIYRIISYYAMKGVGLCYINPILISNDSLKNTT